MVRRSRTQLTDTGTPHVRSARFNGAWLILNVRRELFSFPRTVHVVASVETDSESDSAIHELVSFETDQKKRLVRFELSATDGIKIEPIVPVPETNSGPPIDETKFPTAIQVEISIINIDDEKEFDAVTIDIEKTDGTLSIIDIHD